MSAENYRKCAEECLDWARAANSKTEREIFEQMAVTWLEAAVLLELCRKDDPQTEFLAAKLVG